MKNTPTRARTCVVFSCLFISGLLTAQVRSESTGQVESGSPVVLPEIVVTPTRSEQAPHDSPYTSTLVGGKDIQGRKLSRTTPDAMDETPGILLQKTGHGQGSPFIRGFTGFRTLFLIDGIRLNNSVFRDGPNQYWNTVDSFTIDRLEVVKGPGSVMYGSDAVGGTVSVFTRGAADLSPGSRWDRNL